MDPSYADLLTDDGQIRPDKIDDLLVEVVSGKLLFTATAQPDVMYAARWPTAAEQDQGRVIYIKKLKEAIAKGSLPRDQLEKLALQRGLFKPDERTERDSITRMLERQQSALERTTSEQQRAELKKEMAVARKRVMEIAMAEQEILQHAAEGRAEEARFSYYLSCCILGGDLLDTPVWDSWNALLNSSDWMLINDARRALTRVMAGLPVEVIRALARSTEWRVRWKTSRESGASPFDGSSAQWDKNKVNLIYWSDFYDSILQHPECPDETTVNDDELLQQWLNTQIAKRKQQQPATGTHRPSPTYIDGKGQRQRMHKVGGDQVVHVGTPYKIRT